MSVVSRILKRKVGSKIYGPYFQQHYYCPGRIQKRGCKMGWIRKDKIESLVWREIEKYIKNPTYIKQIIKAAHEKNQDKSVPLKRELIRVASRIEKTELEKEKILRLYREDIVTKNELLSQVEEIRTKRQTLGQQKRQIELKIESEKHLKEKLDTLEKIVKKMQKNIDNLNFQGKRKIINALIENISIKENGSIQLQLIIPSFGQNYTRPLAA